MKPGAFVVRLVIALVLLFSVSLPGAPVAAAGEATDLVDLAGISAQPKADSKLQQVLAELVAASVKLEASSFSISRAIALDGDRVRVVIEAQPGTAAYLTETAGALGATVEATYSDLIQALVPVSRLTSRARKTGARRGPGPPY